MYDICGLGEMVIDFGPGGVSDNGNLLFECNPGGGTANVLVATSRLGMKAAYIGCVGDDSFGYILRDTLKNGGVDTKGMVFTKEAKTCLVFVTLDKGGDRSFTFFRNPGAETMLRQDDVDYSIIDASKIMHYSSITMTHEPSRSATLAAVKYAKEKGLLMSYDPNLRPALWDNLETAKKYMTKGLDYCDILKISDEELEFLTGETNLEKGTMLLREKGIKLICVTMGPKGCFYRYKDTISLHHTYDTKVVDTTGAGDSFLGSLLYKINKSQKNINELDKEFLDEAVDFANAGGATNATKKGAIPAMPNEASILATIANVERLMM